LEEAIADSQNARSIWLENRKQGASAGQLASSLPSEKDALQKFLNLNQ
jgi:hypothetical protein